MPVDVGVELCAELFERGSERSLIIRAEGDLDVEGAQALWNRAKIDLTAEYGDDSLTQGTCVGNFVVADGACRAVRGHNEHHDVARRDHGFKSRPPLVLGGKEHVRVCVGPLRAIKNRLVSSRFEGNYKTLKKKGVFAAIGKEDSRPLPVLRRELLGHFSRPQNDWSGHVTVVGVGTSLKGPAGSQYQCQEQCIKPPPAGSITIEGDRRSTKVKLAPGQEIELAEVKLELRPASESGNKKENTLYGTGKFQIHYERLIYSSGKRDIRSILRDLATGKLELEIEPDRPAEKK